MPFFTSYTVTGDYNITSVDLPPQKAPNGTVTTTLQVSGVPENADIIAAFLYWETIWSGPAGNVELLKDQVRFRGEPVSGIKSSTRSLVGPFSPCWSNGGDTLTMFRADVRRLLPPQLQPGEPLKPTGKRVVNHAELLQYQSDFPDDNWLLTATLPEAGHGNKAPQTGGVSLLLIWRYPDLNPAGAQSLKTIVVYDGVHIQGRGEPTVQTIGGFLQSSSSGADAKVTIMAGTGAPNKTDRILFVNGELSDVSPTMTLIGADRFRRASGGSSDRAWSSPTIDVGPYMPGTNNWDGFGEQVTVAVDHGKRSPYDCLATAAIVFSTNVQDADPGGGDGLNDFLEEQRPGS